MPFFEADSYIGLNNLVNMVDLGDETTLGTDRVAFRLRLYHFAGIYAELKTIIIDGVDLAGLVVANARAQALFEEWQCWNQIDRLWIQGLINGINYGEWFSRRREC